MCENGSVNVHLKSATMESLTPKGSMEAVLRAVRRPRSSSIYNELAAQVSLRRCVDPAFNKLKTTLQDWFPAS